MNYIKVLKKNNGSTLTLVLFMLFMLSVTAIAVVTVTSSEFGMSVMTSDRSRALMIAQAGAEEAAQVLDEQVAKAQDEARLNTSSTIDAIIEEFRLRPWSINGTRLKDILVLTDMGEVKVLNEDKFNSIYRENYEYEFSKIMRAWFNLQKSADKEWAPSWPHYVKKDETGGDTAENRAGRYIYSGAEAENGNAVMDVYRSQIMQVSNISIISTGEVISSRGSTYKRSIQTKFGLLTVASGGSEEIPVAYGKLTKVRINSRNKPAILSDYAVIAEKNIISAGGEVNIKGNVMCFGTVPANADSEDKYKSSLSGYDFGGIMAGITSSVLSSFGLSGGLTGNAHELGLSSDFSDTNHSGNFKIEGKAGTLGYVHSLYGKSNITVTGDIYARSVKVEEKAHSSQLKLNNVYVNDDLRIDANNAKAYIGNVWNENKAYYEQEGTKGKLVGLSVGTTAPYSSAAAVSGDSKLYINGSVYMGGSTYFNEYTRAGNEMYPSGLSVLKSGSLPAQAYEMADGDILPEPDGSGFPGNVFYLYDNTEDKYRFVTELSEADKLIRADYQKKSGANTLTRSMMQGRRYIDIENPEDYIIENPFTIIHRAMHFKQIWEQFWKKDIGYSTYINTGDIYISTDMSNKIDGWSFGAVAANDRVYGPYKGFTQFNSDKYLEEKSAGNNKYAEFMKLFVSYKADDDAKNAEAVTNKKVPEYKLTDNSIDASALAAEEGKIIKSRSGIIMLYSQDDVVLTENSVIGLKDTMNFSEADDLQGIIYSKNDIYVKKGFKFKGILIASGNIVFVGNEAESSKSEILYDEAVIDTLMSEEPTVAAFFKYSPEDILINDKSLIATIKKSNVKNIKIITWKEI